MTVRTIPPLLQADMDADVGTLTIVMQMLSTDGTVLGLAGLDRRIDYDAGDVDGPFAGLGETTYLPDPGVDPTEIEHANDLSVDGGDGQVLVPFPLSATPITPEDIRAGKWADARFRVLRLNYEALDHGHYELLSGYIGDITLRDDQLLIFQLDGPTRALKQTMCWLDSIACRAVHGSQEDEAIEFCGYNATANLIAFTVTDVDPDDSTRSFTASGLAQAANYFVPGGLLWDTGDNAGNTFRGIDTHLAGGVIGLRDSMPRPIQIGDTGRIRINCTNQVEGRRGCREFFGNDWVLHYQGEPDIPLDGTAMTPGANLGPGRGGASSQPSPETAPE